MLNMDVHATRKGETLGGEVELPCRHSVKWERVSWVIKDESYNERSILEICMECNWPAILDHAYVKLQAVPRSLAAEEEALQEGPQATQSTEKG